jgi:hypothetical protein
MPKYEGPADVFIDPATGKEYRQGQNVPLSKATVDHMSKTINGGHRFEGVEPEPRPRGSDLRQAQARDASGEFAEAKELAKEAKE